MGRHEQREQLFMLLFRVEFNSKEDMPEQVKLFFEDEERSEVGEYAEPIVAKYEKIMEKLPELDQLLNEKTEKWNTKRIGKVELTVLRLALYELLFDDEIPEGVAIDEAVTIAKKYGQDSSGAFVNGVLAKFVKKGDQNS
ncbi:MAG: transcription antitermination factor NusB [Lachnospiraceae bacterium]|jgi:N utilization substance protein B|nr:transcription antitermination factor NusB [Lachnospiraceae bacterium]